MESYTHIQEAVTTLVTENEDDPRWIMNWVINEALGVKAEWLEVHRRTTFLKGLTPEEKQQVLEEHKEKLSKLREIDINSQEAQEAFFSLLAEQVHYDPDQPNMEQPPVEDMGFIPIKLE